jgi:hypothetical protein
MQRRTTHCIEKIHTRVGYNSLQLKYRVYYNNKKKKRCHPQNGCTGQVTFNGEGHFMLLLVTLGLGVFDAEEGPSGCESQFPNSFKSLFLVSST